MGRTLLIIGAGASKAIHESFPTGLELAQLIDVHLITTQKNKNYDSACPYISSMMNRAKDVLGFETNELSKIADDLKRPLWGYVQEYYYNAIRFGAPGISIDKLIASISEPNKEQITNLAKFCIAYHLKGQERAFSERLNQFPSLLKDNWVYHFFSLLRSKSNSADHLNNWDVVSFNYDRLFEFLANKAIASLFDGQLSGYNIKNSINYIYGNIGFLDELSLEKNNDELLSTSHLNIRLIEERPSTSINNIHSYEKILFIGFGFDKTNLSQALKLDQTNKVNCLGMCYEKKTDFLKEIQKEFNIEIEQYSSIQEFLNKII